jgi:hypothetical protein
MRDALGIAAKPREVKKVKDSPAQARLRSEGRDAEADALASDDYSAGVLGPSEVYEAWGSPTLTDPTVPDGHPQPIPPPKSEAARQARPPDESVVNGPSPGESAAEVMREAAEEAKRIRRAARADVEQAKSRAEAAKLYGSQEEKVAAAKNARGAAALARAVIANLGGRL